MNACCKCQKPFVGVTAKTVVCPECKKLANALRQTKWRNQNPQQEKIQQHNWYTKNKEYVKQQTKRWQKANPDKVKAAALKREFPALPEEVLEVVAVHRQIKHFIKETNNGKNNKATTN